MRRTLVVLAATTAAAASLMITTVGSAAAEPPAAAAASVAGGQPTDIDPNNHTLDPIRVDPATNKIVTTMRGTGKQVYDCASGVYKPREPVAVLTNLRDGQAGIHGAGPFWASFDGSRVVGISPVLDTAPSPDGPSNVAWLKVTAKEKFGDGVFGKVNFIQRIHTKGGVPPTSCTGTSTLAVNYTTIYVFWAPK